MTIFVSKIISSKKMLVLILLCCYIGSIIMPQLGVFAQENLQMYSGSYALMDGDTGRVLVGKEYTKAKANASTTKILTAIVTLENCNLDELVTVSANASSQPKVRYGIKEGQQYQLKELIYGLMLESYNDCAVAIAEHVAGSEEEFAEMLNAKAKEIGCKDTYFITPNGLDAENEEGFHHTTAEDLCKIMAYCVWESPQKKEFLEITQTRSYGNFVNRNAFLDQMEGVLSGKTGFTAKAGYCYVAALERNGERYTIALLACGWPNNKTYKWKDASTLFSYGIDTYDLKEVVIEERIENVEIEGYVNSPVFSGLNQTVLLPILSEKRMYRLLMSPDDQIKEECILYSNRDLPIEKGMILGEYNLYLDEMKIDTIPLVAKENADDWDLLKIWYVIIGQFFSVSS